MALSYPDDPLADLCDEGVAVWLDDLSRELLASGELRSLISSRHVVGVTTNPAILASALAHKDRYRSQLAKLAEQGADVDAAVQAVATADVRAACDLLRPVYQRTGGRDGRVSIEVDPRLSHDAEATIGAARRLWETVRRENLFVKIPATRAGLAATTAVISQGISVNVTLIFSRDRYREVMDAYLSGLEKARAGGLNLTAIHSVASFLVSRVDSEVDARLEELERVGRLRGPAVAGLRGPAVAGLRGQAAIANARLAYREFADVTASRRWRDLAAAGARRQRPLWASTGVKNDAYPDTRYVSELIAPQTVSSMPRATLAAFADHGVADEDTITGRYAEAERTLAQLAEVGIDFGDVTAQLEREDLATLEESRAELGAVVAGELRRG